MSAWRIRSSAPRASSSESATSSVGPFLCLEQHPHRVAHSRAAQVRQLAESARHHRSADVLPGGLAASRAHVVYSGSSTSSRLAPAASASRAASRTSRAVRLASHVLPEPGPPRTTSRAHRRARSSASRSWPAALRPLTMRSFRSIAAGVSTWAAEPGVLRPRVGVQPPDQRGQVDRHLALVRRAGREPVEHLRQLARQAREAIGVGRVLTGEQGGEVGVQAEQRPVERAGLVGLHPVQPGEQHLLEPLRLKIADGELEQATRDRPPRLERVRPGRSGRHDAIMPREILDRARPTSIQVLSCSSSSRIGRELGHRTASQRRRPPGRCGSARPSAAAAGTIPGRPGQVRRRPGHRQPDQGRADRTLDQPGQQRHQRKQRQHKKKYPVRHRLAARRRPPVPACREKPRSVC